MPCGRHEGWYFGMRRSRSTKPPRYISVSNSAARLYDQSNSEADKVTAFVGSDLFWSVRGMLVDRRCMPFSDRIGVEKSHNHCTLYSNRDQRVRLSFYEYEPADRGKRDRQPCIGWEPMESPLTRAANGEKTKTPLPLILNLVAGPWHQTLI